MTLADISVADGDLSCTVGRWKSPTGGSLYAGLVARRVDANTAYILDLVVSAASSVTLRLRKLIGGTYTVLATQPLALVHSPTHVYGIRLHLQGSLLRGRAWDAQRGTEPHEWPIDTVDTSITSAGRFGCWSNVDPANTNSLPVSFSFGSFAVKPPAGPIIDVIETGAITIPVDTTGQAVLKSVHRPALSRRVNVVDYDERTTPGRILGEHEVLDRPNKVIITDCIGGREGSITLTTFADRSGYYGDSHWRDLAALIAHGDTLLLQTAGASATGEDDLYLEVKSVTRTRVGPIGGDLSYVHEIDFVEVDRPATSDAALGLRSWQDILDNYGSWQEVYATYPIWLGLLG